MDTNAITQLLLKAFAQMNCEDYEVSNTTIAAVSKVAFKWHIEGSFDADVVCDEMTMNYTIDSDDGKVFTVTIEADDGTYTQVVKA